MSKLVNFSDIAFFHCDNDKDECRYQSISENIRLGRDEGRTLEVDAIVKDKETGKLYKTMYYAWHDDYNDGIGSSGEDSSSEEYDAGGDGWCKLIEVKGKEVMKIEYVECDDGKEVDEREWEGEEDGEDLD